MVTAPIEVTETKQAFTGQGILRGVTLAAAAADATLTLYDNTAGSGTKLAVLAVAAKGTVPLTPLAVAFYKGIYAVLAGAGATAMIYA